MPRLKIEDLTKVVGKERKLLFFQILTLCTCEWSCLYRLRSQDAETAFRTAHLTASIDLHTELNLSH